MKNIILLMLVIGVMWLPRRMRYDPDVETTRRPAVFTVCRDYSPGVELCITGPFFATYGNPFE